ncbi:hypothetical protein WA158_001080 [Blastocystis sp. Blastoise]
MSDSNTLNESLIPESLENTKETVIDVPADEHITKTNEGIIYDTEKRTKLGNSTAYVGMAVNIFLVIIKFIMGYLGHSSAMIADALHSLTDLVSDFATWLVLTLARKPADEGHPYGHGRFELTGSLMISILLVVVGFGIGWESYTKIRDQEEVIVEGIALWAAAISLFANEGLFWYAYLIGKKINSQVVIANAWHHRADAIASIVAFVGIGLNMWLQWWWADPVAGLLVALMIIYVGGDIGYKSISSLSDKQPINVKQQIDSIVGGMDIVQGYSNVRVREMGPFFIVDLKVHVNSSMSMKEAEAITNEVTSVIKTQMPNVSEVIISLITSDAQDKENTLISQRHLLDCIRHDINSINGVSNIRDLRLSDEEPFDVDMHITTTDDLTPEEKQSILSKAKDLVHSYKNVHNAQISLDTI